MSNKWVTWCIFIFLFLNSCVSIVPPTKYYYTQHQQAVYPARIIQVYIDKQFGEADKIEMQKAIDQWNFALNNNIKIEISPIPFDMEPQLIEQIRREKGWIFMKIDKNNPMIPPDTVAGPDTPRYFTMAFCDFVGGSKTWFIRDKIDDTDKIYGITLHEIGHLLGARHTGKLLMSPHFDAEAYKCVDKGTVNQVSDFIGIPIEELNYCLYEGD